MCDLCLSIPYPFHELHSFNASVANTKNPAFSNWTVKNCLFSTHHIFKSAEVCSTGSSHRDIDIWILTDGTLRKHTQNRHWWIYRVICQVWASSTLQHQAFVLRRKALTILNIPFFLFLHLYNVADWDVVWVCLLSCIAENEDFQMIHAS